MPTGFATSHPTQAHVARRAGRCARVFAAGLAAAALCATTLFASPSEAGWGARKSTDPAPTVKPQKPKQKRPSKPAAGAKKTARPASAAAAQGAATSPAAATPSTSLSARVASALRPPLRVRALLPLLREAVAAREIPSALQIADAVVAAPRVSASDLVDVASALGSGQPLPVQLALWQRASRSRGVSPWLRDVIEEGLSDALLAAGQLDQAHAALLTALRRRKAGERGPIVERLVAWARVKGQIDEVRDALLRLRDPDAAIQAARLVAELDGDEAGVAVLRDAFRAFPGHRKLAAALLDALARAGARDELEHVIEKVVALSPTEAMPWLRLIDAHIAVRDASAARKLIDRLAQRFRHDDALLEALIDREQRIGDEPARIAGLYDALLRAAPKNVGYIEAYGEWLLLRGHGRVDEAMTVLRRLETLPHGRYEGKRRIAALLAAHGHHAEARGLLGELEREFPDRRATRRAMAVLDDTDRSRNAEPQWLALSQIPAGADLELRRDIAEARRSLISNWRRRNQLAIRLRELGARLAAGHATLADALILLDGLISEDDLDGQRVLPDAALADDATLLQRHAEDSEVLSRVAVLRLLRGAPVKALAMAQRLVKRDPDAARDLAARIAEAALTAGDAVTAADAEAIVLGDGPETTALLQLGDQHLRVGDRVGASALYRRAATLAPNDTRATGRLAHLFREDGDLASEDEALRAVVVRSIDADELEAAGQRLLTLAMARGEAAGLLRWLDAVTPQHPRREVIERFRLLAYDVWLRTEPFERRMRGEQPGEERDDPGPSRLGDALAKGDLAMRVRALRQLARSHRALPAALARTLLRDPSVVVRREAVLAIAASGDVNAIGLLLDMEVERSLDVLLVQLLAIGRLPPSAKTVSLLQERLAQRNTDLATVAVLALGHAAEPGALADLLRAVSHRRELRAALLFALGATLGAQPDREEAPQVLDLLMQAARLEAGHERQPALYLAASAMWALAATGRDDARQLLARATVEADGPFLRQLGVRLLGAKARPEIGSDVFEVDLAQQSQMRNSILARILLPWVTPNPSELRESLASADPLLAEALLRRSPAARLPFCDELWPADTSDAAVGGDASATRAACVLARRPRDAQQPTP